MHKCVELKIALFMVFPICVHMESTNDKYNGRYEENLNLYKICKQYHFFHPIQLKKKSALLHNVKLLAKCNMMMIILETFKSAWCIITIYMYTM